MYKDNSTALSITLANTMINGIRNVNNNGKCKPSTLIKTDSFTVDDLDQFEEEINKKKSKESSTISALDVTVVLFSMQTLESLEAVQEVETN